MIHDMMKTFSRRELDAAVACGKAEGRAAAIEECASALPAGYKFSDYPDLQRMAENAVATFCGYIRALQHEKYC